MWSRGPWGGPFTGVSKLLLFLLWKKGPKWVAQETKKFGVRGLASQKDYTDTSLGGFSIGEHGERNEEEEKGRGSKEKAAK